MQTYKNRKNGLRVQAQYKPGIRHYQVSIGKSKLMVFERIFDTLFEPINL